MTDKTEKEPDFEALRAERNRIIRESMQRLAVEEDLPVEALCSNYPWSDCYCACSAGGPCEHRWDGDGAEFDEGRGWTATCSRCGGTAIGHCMRNGL